MCDECGKENVIPLNKLTQEELMERHSDLITEIAIMAIEISNYQKSIHKLTENCEEVELEMEIRDAKESGSLN